MICDFADAKKFLEANILRCYLNLKKKRNKKMVKLPLSD